ncbi:MAG: transcriptional regulator, TetR family [Mycobacterium sp.]|nr:transcriptional regulator, TetR family [Mycobacterium sp.]
MARIKSDRSEATRAALMDAALKVITETGVKSVTHRRVCAAANVSLGTVSYHYGDLDDLLIDAFTLYVERQSLKYENSFSAARSDEDLADAVLALIEALADDSDTAVLLWELYAAGGRDTRYNKLVRKWSRRAKSGVAAYCGSTTATALEALWDGAVMQRVVGDAHLSDEELHRVVLSIIRSDRSRHYPQLEEATSGAG